MSAPTASRLGFSGTGLDWLPVVSGFLLLFVPSFYELATTHWSSDEGAHAPLILAVAAWLVWRRRNVLLESAHGAPVLGVGLLLPGLLLYVLGRAHTLPIFEIIALMLLASGAVLAMRGKNALRLLWFPIAFLVFMIPLPGFVVDAVTGHLKQQVSVLAEQVLYLAGYPVARSGVVITIGPYQLLVADACAGLQSMFSLSALGLLFVHLTARPGILHNAAMVASILPIAFIANLVRVLFLLLITFHLGDEAGQGFLHGATGILLFVVALSCLIGLDAALAGLARLLRRKG